MSRLFRRITWAVGLALLGSLPLGCGSTDPFDYVKVSGKVTYEDGSVIPAEFLRVTFVPQEGTIDAQTNPRPGVAEVNVADGTFSVVTSLKYDDGIVPGTHKVTVVALDGLQTPTAAVPKEYQDQQTTPLSVNTDDAPFELKIRKP